jgi:membrane protein implicated in regulation of membrane protease activity
VRIFARYLLFEVWGWLFAAALLGTLTWWEWVPLWLSVALVAGLIVKDLVMFPFVRKAYEPGPAHGATELLGAQVRVENELAPEGYVRAGPERWRARLASGEGRLAPGEAARVRAIDSLTLVVEPADP